MIRKAVFVLLLTLNPLGFTASAAPLGTAFTYQGKLTDAGNPANGIYDLQFAIYAEPGGGNPIAGPVTLSPVGVTNGLFTVTLDFGTGVFTGSARWLEIAVKSNGAGTFTTLAPRQPLTPTPYAQFAANTATLGGQGASAFVAKTGDTMTGALVVNQDISTPRLIADGPPPGGGALTLRNLGKTGNAANAWEIYNMTGVYGDSFQIWSYAANASSYGPRFILADDGTTVLGPSGGKVGIGTGTPTQELEVVGEVAAAAFIADAGTPEGGRLMLRNWGKTGTAAYEWALFNMSGGYSDSFQIWSYAADQSWWGSRFIIRDDGTTVLGPSGGNVGIGTANPAAKLEVQGGPIKATGGLIIENRTNDPPSPAPGQIWLRTDL